MSPDRPRREPLESDRIFQFTRRMTMKKLFAATGLLLFAGSAAYAAAPQALASAAASCCAALAACCGLPCCP